jgi:hypothetical protein
LRPSAWRRRDGNIGRAHDASPDNLPSIEYTPGNQVRTVDVIARIGKAVRAGSRPPVRPRGTPILPARRGSRFRAALLDQTFQ